MASDTPTEILHHNWAKIVCELKESGVNQNAYARSGAIEPVTSADHQLSLSGDAKSAKSVFDGQKM